MIIFIPVNKHYDIGILLNGAGFTEVGEYGTFVLACFGGAVQLGQGYYGNVQLLGQGLEISGDGTHLLFAGAELHACGVHELQVVYYYHPDTMFAYQPSGFGAEFRDREAGGLVYIHGGSEEVVLACR